AVGLSLLWRHARRREGQDERRTTNDERPAAEEHGHDHFHWHGGHGHTHADGHAHSHAHGHSNAHGHHHHHDYDRVLAGGRVRFASLLALGISGGIVPCPGALVVLLGAVAMHRVGFGLALILAFSLGLATVLTGIGLLMVSARGILERLPALGDGRWSRKLSVCSAVVVTALGVGLTLQSVGSGGLVRLPGLSPTMLVPLGIGFVLGLRHALDADHLVAVSTIVSEHRSVFRSAWVGVCWGLGHTTSLFVMGLAV